MSPRLRPEERRRPLQYLVRTPQLPDFLLELPHPARFGGGHSGDMAVVNICLLDPHAHRLDPVAELRRNPMDRPMLSPELRAQRPHHPDRGGLLLGRIPTSRRLPRSLLRHHDSIFVSKVRSLQQTQGASLCTIRTADNSTRRVGADLRAVPQSPTRTPCHAVPIHRPGRGSHPRRTPRTESFIDKTVGS